MKEFYPNDCEMDHSEAATADNSPATLTAARRRLWLERGILRVPGVVGRRRLAALKAALADATGLGASATRAGNRGLLDCSRPVRELAVSASVLTLARALIGARARPVKATLFDKMPGANWTLPWHQDLTVALRQPAEVPGFSRWSLKGGVAHAEAPLGLLNRMVALRVHLDDCDARNGALLVVPGSHRRGKLAAPARRDLPAELGSSVCPAEAGDILAMHPLLLHRSLPAEEPSHRRVIHLEYAAAPLPAGLTWRYDPLAEGGSAVREAKPGG